MAQTVGRASVALLLLVTLPAHTNEAAVPDEPKRIILETDMTFDVDDVGALAVLHALADDGRAKIIAVNYNEVHENGASAIDAINTWYGRSDIPVGVYRSELPDPDPSRYLDHLAAFPRRLTADGAPDALDVYRRVLNDQPDGSVTIVSVGFLNNLADLLRAETDLVASKVEKLVVMGGRHNDGFNLVRHGLVDTTQEVIENWPTPLAISDYGGRVHTGATLADTSADNPVREAYFRWFGGRFEGRSSWDQVAVLYAIYGAGDWFEDVASGTGSLRNGYSWQLKSGWRTYVGPKRSEEGFVDLIERLMVEPPRN
ncbi:MAG: nucleoside hydrolase [Gammaproteobacteria bacterium]|nr:nucleoside hydrolase [Gammaproteobacteria bacterium]